MMNISGTQSDKPEDNTTARRPLADDVLIELTAWQSHLRMAAFRSLSRGALSIVHLSVLAALEHHGPLSMTKLAKAMGVSVASATGIVTRMEERGVVRRRHDDADRRVVRVEVTKAGLKVSSDMEKHRNQRLRKVLDGLTDEELASFLLGLRALGASRARLQLGFEKTESGIVVARKRERPR